MVVLSQWDLVQDLAVLLFYLIFGFFNTACKKLTINMNVNSVCLTVYSVYAVLRDRP